MITSFYYLFKGPGRLFIFEYFVFNLLYLQVGLTPSPVFAGLVQ